MISPGDRRPMYRQVMERIRRKIATGAWPGGHALPSMRALAAALAVSVITIKRAYMELEHEGLITIRQGRGSFVTDDRDIGARLQREELQHHLEEAVKRARLMGMDLSELLDLVRRVRAEMLTHR